MAEWGRTYGGEICRALGFTRAQPPCAATFSLLFRQLDRAALEACLSAWATQVLAAVPGEAAPPRPALAIDGKTVRGSPSCSPPSVIAWASRLGR